MKKVTAFAVFAFSVPSLGAPHGLQGQTNFYQGKPITIVVGTVPAGLYDRWGSGPRKRGTMMLYIRGDTPYRSMAGVPTERVKILREAYAKSLSDPELLDAVKRSRLDREPITGPEIDAI